MNNFHYIQPADLEEVLERLRMYGDEAKLLAGGQSLILLMREGLVQPGVVISLSAVPGLDEIQLNDSGELEIGALVTHRQLEKSAAARDLFPFLSEAYRLLASVPVRHMATLGGNLCHNAPGSDPPALLMVLDAAVTLRGAAGERIVKLEEFGTDYYATAIEIGEVLTRVNVPLLPVHSGAAYHKYAARATDMAVVGAAARITLEPHSGRCVEARIALAGVAPTTIRARKAEATLVGQPFSPALVAEAAAVAVGETDPISDMHGSADYRRRLTRPAVERMVARAWQEAVSQNVAQRNLVAE